MKNLPVETREAIGSFDWGKVSEEVGKKYKLSESEINDMQIEVGLVLIGVAYGEALASSIETEVGVEKKLAEKIAVELDQRVFKPIYEIMEQKIKNGLKNKNPTWKQNVEFVLSGGDYTVFQEFPEQPAENPEPAAKIDASFITKKFNI